MMVPNTVSIASVLLLLITPHAVHGRKVPILARHSAELSNDCLDADQECHAASDDNCREDPATLACCRDLGAIVDCLLNSESCSSSDIQLIEEPFAREGIDLQEFRTPAWCDDNLDDFLALVGDPGSAESDPTPDVYPTTYPSPYVTPFPHGTPGNPTEQASTSALPYATYDPYSSYYPHHSDYYDDYDHHYHGDHDHDHDHGHYGGYTDEEYGEHSFEEGSEYDDYSFEEERELEQLSACFPSDAKLELRNGDRVPMSSLKTGDFVRVSAGPIRGDNSFGEVFFFSHRDPSKQHLFIELALQDGGTLILSPGHYVSLGDGSQLIAARDVEVGTNLRVASGEFRRVLTTRRIQKRGLFAPHTLSPRKTLVVDGVLVSEFTESVHPRIGGPLLRMAGILYQSLGSFPESMSSVLHSEGHWMAEFLQLGVGSRVSHA